LKAEIGNIGNMSNRGGNFYLKAYKAQEDVREILRGEFSEVPGLEHNHSLTVDLDRQHFAGEVVLLEGETIHCSFPKTGDRE